MDSKSDNIVIRPATGMDYKSVMAINDNVYEGFDFLPPTYFNSVQLHRTFPYVAVDGDKVVGFVQYVLLDNGETVYGGAMRVAKSHQGLKITEKLDNTVQAHLTQKYPDSRYTAFLFVVNDSAERLIDRKHLTRSTRLYLLRYTSTYEDLKISVERLVLPSQSRCLSLSEAYKLIPDICDVIRSVSNDTITTRCPSWQPSRGVTPSDVRERVLHNGVIASFGEDGILCGVSFMTLMSSGMNGNSRCNIFYYGKDTDILLDQLLVGLRKMADACSREGAAALYLVYPESLPVEQVMNAIPSSLKLYPMYDKPGANAIQLAYGKL